MSLCLRSSYRRSTKNIVSTGDFVYNGLVDEENGPRPTNAEFAILGVLWRFGPSSVREVQGAIGREVGYTTVLKTMQIMREKGLLAREDRGRAHVYRPVAQEATAKRDLLGDLMDRAFGGSARDLVMHALAAKPASAEELAAIRRMLDELEAGG